MNEKRSHQQNVVHAYHKRSTHYDTSVRFFDLFRSFGFDIPAWRLAAVKTLNLKPGNTVVDIGCGTGLNFPFLYNLIGPEGKIIGVDLSEAMLERAHQSTNENDWQNVELVCSDAALYQFPEGLDGILSTFALILVPECDQVVINGCRALQPGGHFSILDMCWPAGWSFNWRHLFFFLRSYGVNLETLQRRPWKTIWKTMEENLLDVAKKRFWFGMMYQISGKKAVVEETRS